MFPRHDTLDIFFVYTLISPSALTLVNTIFCPRIYFAVSRSIVSRPDLERSTRGNRRVPLNGFQFPETQTRARKAFDILTLFKYTILPLFISLLDLGNNSNF